MHEAPFSFIEIAHTFGNYVLLNLVDVFLAIEHCCTVWSRGSCAERFLQIALGHFASFKPWYYSGTVVWGIFNLSRIAFQPQILPFIPFYTVLG